VVPELMKSRPVQIAGQLGAAWVAGAIFLPTAWQTVLLVRFGGGGTLGWALGAATTDAAPAGVSGILLLALGGIPFALAAALFLRGRPAKLTAVGLCVTLVAVFGLVLHR
jgi:hypothetical protein